MFSTWIILREFRFPGWGKIVLENNMLEIARPHLTHEVGQGLSVLEGMGKVCVLLKC